MLLILIIGALVIGFVIVISIINGSFLIPVLWLGCICSSLIIGWVAIVFIKPRYPEWWERNIAGDQVIDP
jgi:hypothetical protein